MLESINTALNWQMILIREGKACSLSIQITGDTNLTSTSTCVLWLASIFTEGTIFADHRWIVANASLSSRFKTMSLSL